MDQIITRCLPFTMTPPARLSALIESVQYLYRHNILGDVVECGVWRGGSMMAAALTLLSENDTGRRLWLYDTFTGMPRPDKEDIRISDGKPAGSLWHPAWAVAGLPEVKRNLFSTGYPTSKIKFIPGLVEQTLQQTKPDQIALLRLDTDWYSSTKSELEMLYPLLARGGILIIDDYGHYQGARKATDEYLGETAKQLKAIDYSARMLIKK